MAPEWKPSMCSLLAHVESYLLARDVSKSYAKLLRSRMKKFARWCGGDFPIADLESDIVNRFLAFLQTTPAAPVTVDNYRRAILCIWRSAYLERLNDNPPLRVRSIRKPRRLVMAFTVDEIKQLLKYAATLAGYFPNGVKRSDFWQAVIHAAYSTGLRRADILKLQKNDIRTDGQIQLVQNKTGYPVTVKLSQETLAILRRMPIEVEAAFGWPYHPNALPRQFRAIVRASGVRPGQFRWMRASAGSYAERDCPGNGSKLLGHKTDHVFRQHYEDHTITRDKPIEPPSLGPLALLLMLFVA